MKHRNFVCILTNKNHSVLYTGVTSNLEFRLILHRNGQFKNSFTSRYNIDMLVYFEEFDRMEDAISREKQIKAGSRLKKIEPINRMNPYWNDLPGICFLQREETLERSGVTQSGEKEIKYNFHYFYLVNQPTFQILIVEDEPKVASFLQQGLEENGFATGIAADGRAGLDLFSAGRYNLVILDIHLPEMNGFDLCMEIRKMDPEVPILILTALGTTADKLMGFDTGADDYMVKPFDFSELLARIRALRKRSSFAGNHPRVLNYHDLEINLDLQTVSRAGNAIELTHKEFSLLEYLVRNRERVVSRSEIAEKVWHINFNTGTNVIDVYINFLRKKIDRDYRPRLIHTHPGVGYILKKDHHDA